MNSEHIEIRLDGALNLLQIITEDMEKNFVGTDIDGTIKARATMTVSALSILYDHLREIQREVATP